jgi:hypothetical protein
MSARTAVESPGIGGLLPSTFMWLIRRLDLSLVVSWETTVPDYRNLSIKVYKAGFLQNE